MRIKITKGGIYNAKGDEIAVGTEMDVKDEPKGWAGRYETISGKKEAKEKVAVTNPKSGALGGDDDQPKTAEEVLALADGNFGVFKAAAAKLLGDKTPSKKEEIIAALKEL